MTTAATVPTSGTWKTGDIVWSGSPLEAGDPSRGYMVIGWICVAGGTPGRWSEMRIALERG